MSAWSAQYTQTVTETNISTAYNAGRFSQSKDPEVRQVAAAFELVVVDDAVTRRGRVPEDRGENHLAGQGLTAAFTDPIWDFAAAPNGYGCYLPGTVVSGTFDRGLKAAYSGPAVEIETLSGKRLRVTGNHPVLTRGGWLPADDVAEGADLVCDQRWDECLLAPDLRAEDDKNGPARVEDVFKALGAETGGPFPSGLVPLDLHGDARFTDGKVDVVGSDGSLPRGAFSESVEQIEDLEFILPFGGSDLPLDGLGGFDALGEGLLPSGGGAPGGAALTLDGSAVHALPLRSLSFGSGAHLDATLLEDPVDDIRAHPELYGELLRRFPSEVASDRVVSVRKFDFVGHVYDFRSSTGWIMSQGLVTSNCRETVRLVSSAELEKRGLLSETGAVVRALPATFGRFAPHPRFRGIRPDQRVYGSTEF